MERRGVRFVLVLLGLLTALSNPIPGVGGDVAAALDAGDRAPEFNLPSTQGVHISLRDFRGKKWVLLEFYGLDFQPT